MGALFGGSMRRVLKSSWCNSVYISAANPVQQLMQDFIVMAGDRGQVDETASVRTIITYYRLT